MDNIFLNQGLSELPDGFSVRKTLSLDFQSKETLETQSVSDLKLHLTLCNTLLHGVDYNDFAKYAV